MKTVLTLPEGYREIETVDFQKNIKLTLWMTVLMFLSAAAVFVTLQSAAYVELFPLPHIPLADSLLFAGAAVLYAFINDLVRFITFYLCGAKYTLCHPKTGCLLTCNLGYMPKKQYLLADAVVAVPLIAIPLIACCLVPGYLLWPIHLVLASIAAKKVPDLYIAIRLLRAPKNTLVDAGGTKYRFYATC